MAEAIAGKGTAPGSTRCARCEPPWSAGDSPSRPSPSARARTPVRNARLMAPSEAIAAPTKRRKAQSKIDKKKVTDLQLAVHLEIDDFDVLDLLAEGDDRVLFLVHVFFE